MSEIWTRHRQSLLHHLANDDIAYFLNWSTVVATMFVGDVGYVEKEYRDIMSGNQHYITDEAHDKFKPVLTELGIGNPQLLWGWTSGNLIHQLYHLKQWMDRSKHKLTDLESIVEIGAGYGAMALLCRRLGFEGRYYVIDFPELEQIQAYYLNRTAPDYRSVTYWVSASHPLGVNSPKSCDLLIGCHSVSEIPAAERETLLAQIDTREWLFASGYEFDGVDNLEWFAGFVENKPQFKWDYYRHPHQENALYIVGIEP